MRRLIFSFILLLVVNVGFSQLSCPIIPLPQSFVVQKDSFLISNATAILINDAGLRNHAGFLQGELLKTAGIAAAFQDKANGPAIRLVKTKGKELTAYQLSVKDSEIKITSDGDEGLFYGINSLMQLVRQAAKDRTAKIGGIEISDKPAKEWRGVMIDESRHFFGKEAIKTVLDEMAFYKLNKFHWHLTDVPGWRLEIKKYPKLTLVGGIGNHTDSLAPSKYYTQEDIKEIVAYAKARFIDVIPEIDMPGHAKASNVAYPQFSGGGTPAKPLFTFNPGKEETYSYLADILKEVNVLFPSGMIHLGGDEVHFGSESWNNDAGVKSLMLKNGFKNLKEVEDYFTKRMADTVFSLNRKILLWDEAATGNLSPDKTIIYWWRHDKETSLKMALDKGYQVVLCPRVPLYFDFTQDTLQRVGRLWKGATTKIEQVYNYDPANEKVIGKRSDQVLGLQGNLWTENIETEQHLQYMLFPRMMALAETAWTNPARKSFSGFMERLKPQLQLLKDDKVYYFNPFNPQENPEPLVAGPVKANK